MVPTRILKDAFPKLGLFGVDTEPAEIEEALENLREQEEELDESLKKVRKAIARLEGWLQEEE